MATVVVGGAGEVIDEREVVADKYVDTDAFAD
jgi:hypothetical protein